MGLHSSDDMFLSSEIFLFFFIFARHLYYLPVVWLAIYAKSNKIKQINNNSLRLQFKYKTIRISSATTYEILRKSF